jgi:uncharacterized membrane protein YdcZ (DUF606 family)
VIAALIHLLIIVIVCGLLIVGLFWIVENFFGVMVPPIVKQAVGVIAILLVCLYLLRVFGVA